MKKFITAIAATLLVSTAIVQAQGWTETQRNTFSTELYDAAKSEGNWDDFVTNRELRILSDCITNYYSESLTYDTAYEYLTEMPPTASREFDTVVKRCYEFVLTNKNPDFI